MVIKTCNTMQKLKFEKLVRFFSPKLQCGLIFMKNLEFSSLISAHQTSNSLKIDDRDPLINSIQIFLANHRPNCLRVDIWSKKKLTPNKSLSKTKKKEIGVWGDMTEEPLNSDLFVLCSFLVDMVSYFTISTSTISKII